MVNRQARNVLMLAVVVAVGMVLLSPIVASVNQNTGTQTVTNESVTATFNETVDLQGYQIVSGSETVYGYNDTSGSYETVPSSDYTLYTENGSIDFNSSSSLIDDGETVKVSYDYEATGELTTTVIGFIPVMVGTLLLVVVGSNVKGAM